MVRAPAETEYSISGSLKPPLAVSMSALVSEPPLSCRVMTWSTQMSNPERSFPSETVTVVASIPSLSR